MLSKNGGIEYYMLSQGSFFYLFSLAYQLEKCLRKLANLLNIHRGKGNSAGYTNQQSCIYINIYPLYIATGCMRVCLCPISSGTAGLIWLIFFVSSILVRGWFLAQIILDPGSGFHLEGVEIELQCMNQFLQKIKNKGESPPYKDFLGLGCVTN